MLIPIIQDYYRQGALPVPKHRVLTPFFPNCNLAVRKSVFNTVGQYDESLQAAEDSDLCRRAAESGYRLFFEPGARVYHACRPNLSALARQWFSYGFWSAAVYKRNMEKRCEIYSSIVPVPRVNESMRFFSLRHFPFPVLVFMTYFSWILLLAAAALTALAAGAEAVSAGLGMGLLFYLLTLYIKHPVLRKVGPGEKIPFLGVSILINISCMAGSLAGGIRNRMFYIFSGI